MNRVLQTLLPRGNTILESRIDAKKILTMLGMDHKSIRECPNDYVLYRGEYEHDYRICGEIKT